MHTPGKGISGSSIPYSRRAPGWLKTTSEEAKELISKLAKKGLTPSQVGIVLRDSHGIGLVKNLTGSKIVRILKAQGKNFHNQISKSGANLHTLRSDYFHFLRNLGGRAALPILGENNLTFLSNFHLLWCPI